MKLRIRYMHTLKGWGDEYWRLWRFDSENHAWYVARVL